jgi:single-strand DNA-binding protein
MSNVFSFVGTCGRDAEVRYSASGLAVLSVNVANNVGYGDKQQTLWVKVTLFGKRAEGSLKDYLLKGQQVFVSGELTLNEYQAKDGTNKTSLELLANVIDLVGKRTNASPSAPPETRPAPPKPSSAPHDDFDDDVPF